MRIVDFTIVACTMAQLLPTLNSALHCTTPPIGILRELNSTCNPIYDRVICLELIDNGCNLAQEVLIHITCYRQLQRAIPHAGSKIKSILSTLSQLKLFPFATATRAFPCGLVLSFKQLSMVCKIKECIVPLNTRQ